MVRLEGLTSEQLAVALDPLPAGAPVVVRYRPPPHTSAAVLVDDALNELELIARQIFPAWLSPAEGLAHSDLDRRAARVLARRIAAKSEHFGPFLADLAEAAVAGRPMAAGYPPDVRAVGLVRLLTAAYHRNSVALLVDAGDEQCADGVRWLADHAGIGVWLMPGALAGVDRFPTVTVTLPEHVADLSPEAPSGPPEQPLDYPPPCGRPHPASAAEQRLEAALARSDWAAGRAWNQTHQSHPLSRQIRVDLVWSAARCVVELDGPDHRGRLKYADDRRRDNALVQEGFVVLRFTNEDVADDLSQVLGIIEQVLAGRRGQM